MAPHVLIAMMTRRMLGYNTHSGVFCAHRHVNGMTAALSISITARENMGESIRLYSVKCELRTNRAAGASRIDPRGEHGAHGHALVAPLCGAVPVSAGAPRAVPTGRSQVTVTGPLRCDGGWRGRRRCGPASVHADMGIQSSPHARTFRSHLMPHMRTAFG